MNLTAKVYLLSCIAFPLTSWAQFAVFGELFISANNEFHIAFEDTYFAGGQIVTAKETRDAGVVSFGHRSRWRQLQKNSYIYGTVKIYHTGRFTFPLGSASIFSPLTLQLSQNTGYIQVSYTEQTPAYSSLQNNHFNLSAYHYWYWNTEGLAQGKIQTYWWPEHNLYKIGFNRFNPLSIGLALNEKNVWKLITSQKLLNPYTEVLPFSIEFGSIRSLESFNFTEYNGLSFAKISTHNTDNEKLISQVLTPNNDGVNDTWKIKGYFFSAKSIIKIYNLNGRLVYEHQGVYYNDWRGGNSFTGDQLPPGSYYFQIFLEGIQRKTVEGWLLIKYN